MYVNHVDLNHVQIYVPIRPRTFEKNLLNLLKSSIPDISTSMSTIFSTGYSPEIFEGVVAFSGVVKLGSITNVTQSAT